MYITQRIPVGPVPSRLGWRDRLRQTKGAFLGSAAGAQGLAMRKNLYVGNLPYDTTADDLREAFSQFGTVSRSQVISDRETGRSRGFGFVEMEDGADTAIESMNGKDFQGRRLTVNEAKSRSDAGGGGSRSRSTY